MCDKVVKSVIFHLPDRHFQFSLFRCASHPLCPLFLLFLFSRTPCFVLAVPRRHRRRLLLCRHLGLKHSRQTPCVCDQRGLERHQSPSLSEKPWPCSWTHCGLLLRLCACAFVCVRVLERAGVCVFMWMQLGDAALPDSHTHFTNTAPLLLGDGLGLGHSHCENLFLPLPLSPAGMLPPSLPSSHSFTLSAELLSFHFLLGKPRTPVVSAFSCSLSLALSVTSKYKRHACTAPRFSLWLSLPRSLARCVSCVRLPPPPCAPPTFFLSVKAAFQMLISSQSKRETARGGMTETSGRFHHMQTYCKAWLLSCTNTQLQKKAARPLQHFFHKCIHYCL